MAMKITKNINKRNTKTSGWIIVMVAVKLRRKNAKMAVKIMKIINKVNTKTSGCITVIVGVKL